MRIQLKMKLGSKITFSTLMMLIVVSVISTIVVSIIMQRQNRAMVQEAMNNSMDTLRHTIIEKQNTMSEAVKQMIAVNKIGATLVFLDEYKDSSYTSGLTQDSYNELIVALYRTSSAGKLWKT